MNNPLFAAVIPAAGSGERFGSDKLMFDLLGKPVLWHTLHAFQEAKSVGMVVIVTRKEHLQEVLRMAEEFPKIFAVVEGGKTRRESVFCGISALPDSVDYVSLHDGARPLITPEEIDRIHACAVACGSVCAALPVYDTIQQVDADGFVVSTPDRAFLMAAATPQVFPLKTYLRCCEKTKGLEFTDDTGLVRAAGEVVRMVLCEGENFKITTRADADRAEMVLKNRGK